MAESHKHDITVADFKLFLVLWNQHMNQRTPDIHFRMAGWLEHCHASGLRSMLLLAFRSSGKSTIAGLFAAWLLYRNPDLRILVLAADYTLAKKMVRTVRRIIERHPLTVALKPENPEQWAGDRFTVRRLAVLRDPSMAAHGVTSNITGSRADIVICDDVEVPGTSDTAARREELRARLSEIQYVLGGGAGIQFYIGTPHNFYTIYADRPRVEAGEERAFLQGFARLEIPIIDAAGESAWPERYGEEDIRRLRIETGPNKFASQMMLKPVNIRDSRLDPDLLAVYSGEMDYAKELRTLFIDGKKMIAASAWWDPAFAAARGDRSVVAVIFSDAGGNFYLHRMLYIKVDPRDQTDEATQQCRQVATLAAALMLPSVTVEGNGMGKFLPRILRNEMVRARALCGVKEAVSSKAKDARILEAFDAPMAARRIYIHKSVLETPFLTEMREWRPYARNGYDDGLDAVAGAIAQEPVRIRSVHGPGRAHDWMQGAQSHAAKTDFKV